MALRSTALTIRSDVQIQAQRQCMRILLSNAKRYALKNGRFGPFTSWSSTDHKLKFYGNFVSNYKAHNFPFSCTTHEAAHLFLIEVNLKTELIIRLVMTTIVEPIL